MGTTRVVGSGGMLRALHGAGATAQRTHVYDSPPTRIKPLHQIVGRAAIYAGERATPCGACSGVSKRCPWRSRHNALGGLDIRPWPLCDALWRPVRRPAGELPVLSMIGALAECLPTGRAPKPVQRLGRPEALADRLFYMSTLNPRPHGGYAGVGRK